MPPKCLSFLTHVVALYVECLFDVNRPSASDAVSYSMCSNKCNCQVPGLGCFISYFIDFIVHLNFKPFFFLRLIIAQK